MNYEQHSPDYQISGPGLRFRLKGVRIFRYVAVISILLVPAILFLENWIGFGLVSFLGISSFTLMLIVLMGFVSQFWENRITVYPDRLEISHHATELSLPTSGISHAQILEPAYGRPAEEETLDFTHGKGRILLITFREGTLSSSRNQSYDEFPVKYVTVSPARPSAVLRAVQNRM